MENQENFIANIGELKDLNKEAMGLLKNLVDAIYDNEMSVQIRENHFGPAIPSQYIADELEAADWFIKEEEKKNGKTK